MDSFACSIKTLRFSLALVFCGFCVGCQSVYHATGDFLIKYTEDETVPYVLSTPDAGLGCGLGEGYTLFMLSFERVTESPDRLGILLKTLAGVCSEQRAWEEELRYLRGVKTKSSAEASDARISQKRYLAQAARRQHQGYMHMVKTFGEPGLGCPKLNDDNEEFLYLIGLVNGLQAVLNNIGADQEAGVPMSVAAKVSRGSRCLNSAKWWGTPQALEAAVWATIPGINQTDIDPIDKLKEASEIGIEQGVRLSQVFEAQIYSAKGDVKAAKQVVKAHAEAVKKMPPDPRLKLMDRISTLQLQFLSDKLWTNAKGHRTPMGRLGHFWDDHKEEALELDIDDLL